MKTPLLLLLYPALALAHPHQQGVEVQVIQLGAAARDLTQQVRAAHGLVE